MILAMVRPRDLGVAERLNRARIRLCELPRQKVAIRPEDESDVSGTGPAHSRTTSCAVLSSLNPAKVASLKCPSGVHSVNSI